jgi:hypothetical protein
MSPPSVYSDDLKRVLADAEHLVQPAPATEEAQGRSA